MITIIDYGMGNIGSVRNMLKHINVSAMVTSDPEKILAAPQLILPGVGSFDEGIRALRERGLDSAIKSAVQELGTPLLGICLGMQLLTKSSEEGQLAGLGLHDSVTRRIPSDLGGTKVRVPHMGWNAVEAVRRHPLTDGLPPQPRFYFVHSFHVCCNDPADEILAVRHGERLTAAFAKGSLVGVQFHPEKSHKYGMALLRNFATSSQC